MPKDLNKSDSAPNMNFDIPGSQKEPGPKQIQFPQVNLPKGGGAIKGIEEKFQVNSLTGTSSFSIPIPVSPSRFGFAPSLSLEYNSGNGNSSFGLGWQIGIPTIARKTEKKLPEYKDEEESDTFILSGAEDLVPFMEKVGDTWEKHKKVIVENGITFTVARYRPRIEGLFARIEKWKKTDTGEVHWRTITRDNIRSYFGLTSESRIQDPKDSLKIFEWKLSQTHDDKGNMIIYRYKKEDFAGIDLKLNEKNRIGNCTQTYLKQVWYGNKQPYRFGNAIPDEDDFMFKVVFDYGEHDPQNPVPKDVFIEKQTWKCRKDPFSSYCSGFEIRTYRRCERILLFHCFSESKLPHSPYLTKSLKLIYDKEIVINNNQLSIQGFSFFTKAIQSGHLWDLPANSYRSKSFPEIEIKYQPHKWNVEVKSVTSENIVNVPSGINRNYIWTDLYSEGISGILTEQADGWFYKSNLGNGNFSHASVVATKPNLTGLSSGRIALLELEADGTKYLVNYASEPKGFFKLTDEQLWEPFQTFTDSPNFDLSDPNMRMIDLDGDGRGDLLMTEDSQLRWYAGAGEKGFELSQTIAKEIDEEAGPAIVFADNTQSIFITDINGDGLADIVRIRNGEIVYWPNLGYGRFGAKINMDNAPLFDYPDNFNPDYLRLADIDGSGTTDLIYLGKNDFRVWMNICGNEWTAEPVIIPSFPQIDNLSDVQILDFLGSGTACIVYSSSISNEPLQYIDLMESKKPHLLVQYLNNCGKEVKIEYKPSTYYFLEDKKQRTPWISKLPFPVHCISQVEISDKITKTRFTNQYTYHHGYFDHHEREFRGFGRVDKTDTEDFENYKKNAFHDGSIQIVDEGFHQPPILTKTWFHTGAYLDNKKVLNHFANEYYNNESIPEKDLSEPILPAGLDNDEYREALRACKGMMLRVEVFSRDGSDKEIHPYTTSRHNSRIQLLQPRVENKCGVFLVLESEALSYTYERNSADPHIVHSMNLETDEFGHTLKSAFVNYGRIIKDPTLTESEQREQEKTYIAFTENSFTNKIDDVADFRLPVKYEEKLYELTGIISETGNYFNITQVKNDFQNAESIPYQALPTAGKIEKRLIEHVSIQFLKNDLSAPLQPGIIESLLLPYKTFKLALTPSLRDFIFGDKVSHDLLIQEGKYVQLNDGNYWITSGTQTFDADLFYQVTEVTDPFGFKTQITYDEDYHLYIKKTTDELGNTNEVPGFNFRTLTPYLVQDINDNRMGVRLDELGMVKSTFVMGKESETKGDLLDVNSVEESVNDQPTSIIEYQLFNYKNTGKPNFFKGSVRETHHFESLATGKPVIWQTAYSYSDGSGNQVMQKVQAEPGLALKENADGSITEIDTTPNLRWIGNGRTILNNKGQGVKQYEPYFSVTFEFEDAKELVERGVTPLIHYDPAGRVIKTEYPDGTFTKVEFDTWKQVTFDKNDTVLDSQWYRDRIDIPVPGIATSEQIAAATRAAAHANTPAISHRDSLGNVFLTIVDNAQLGKYKTLVESDFEGNIRKITDARGNIVMFYKYDMLGLQLYQNSMDTGERWAITDAMGKPLRTWDSRNHEFSFEYDSLHRPTLKKVKGGDGTVLLDNIFEKTIYGEGLPNDKAKNFRGKPIIAYDTAGKEEVIKCDFKGNALSSARQFSGKYKETVNWSTNNPDDVLETETFLSSVEYDALNRVTRQIYPDSSVYEPVYNEAGLLDKVRLIQNGVESAFVNNIDYNEKGQRNKIIYANGVKTEYSYDKNTFRLLHMETKRMNNDPLQDLYYTFDPVGNITQLEDKNIPVVFFNNQKIVGIAEYTYDSIYRLISATGREHAGQLAFGGEDNWNDLPFMKKYSVNDELAWRSYTQQYLYDAVGNILQVTHNAVAGNWSRNYNPSNENNRLLSTTIDNNTYQYTHHQQHGFILTLPHLQMMQWNFKEELQAIARQKIVNGTPETTYYVYDGKGKRVRKITERQAAPAVVPSKKNERIYVGGIEIYREYDTANTLSLERQTCHVADDTRRIAMVETRTAGTDDAPAKLVRYQFDNHLRSAAIETDETGRVISYEEYHPFGTTSYQAGDKDIKAAHKRYRYSGMERDEESGLEYHSARYYVPWIGRWLNADPIGIGGGMNLYVYSNNNPVRNIDTSGNGPYSPQDVKDQTITATDTKHILNQDLLVNTKVVTKIGYGWVADKNENMERKVHFNYISTYTDNYGIGKSWETHEFITFEIEPEFRNKRAPIIIEKYTHTSKVDVSEVKPYKPKPKPSTSSFKNRVFGVLKVVAGILEGLGSIALLLAPEPTMLTKVGGVWLGAHSLDTLVAGFRQIVSGESTSTITEQAITKTASALGASESTAHTIGVIGDLGAGLGPQLGIKGITVGTEKTLVHLTSKESAVLINESQILGTGRAIYAGPATNAGTGMLGTAAKTGLSASKNVPITIPSNALPFFFRPVPFGPATTWQYLTNQAYTLPGRIDMSAGIFERGAAFNWGSFWFGFTDIAVKPMLSQPELVIGN